MIFNIVTLFTDFFESPLHSGLLGKAVESGLISVNVVDLRDYSEGNYRRCDDYPYGGGAGMVLKPEPLFKALDDLKRDDSQVVLTSPAGKVFSQTIAEDLARHREICLVCGHYEGVDQRVIDKYVDCEISVGDYVLSGGEYAALVIVDAVSRLVPGFMSNEESLMEESFNDFLLEYPHYTRPAEYQGLWVPEVLISGNHGNIAEWRLQQRIEKTRRVRPDLYKRYLLRKKMGDT